MAEMASSAQGLKIAEIVSKGTIFLLQSANSSKERCYMVV